MIPQANYTVTQDLVDYLSGQADEVVGDQTLLLARAETYIDAIAAGRPMVIPATDTVHMLAITGNPTGGTITPSLIIGGVTYTTAPIPFNSQSATVAGYFAGIPGFPGTVSATGGPLPYSPMFIGYRGGLGAQLIPQGSVAAALTGDPGAAVQFLMSAPGGGMRKRFNLSALMASNILAVKNAVAAQAEYMLRMDDKLFVEPQYDSIRGPDFTTTGKLPVVSPKARRELGLAGLLYGTARSRP